MKKLLWVFALAFSLSMFSNGVPPTLSNFRIEKGQTSKVYFDSNKSITASSTKGFTISGKKISGISINSGKTTGHYFKVSQSFTFWDNNTIRYNGGSNLKDKDNNSLSDFTLEYITNKIAEPKSSTYRYVSLTGNNKNDGKSESKAWRTIDKAASTATSGMTVWIKAGNYGNENVVLDKSGTVSKPIKFIGYKSKIGDINSMYYKYGQGKLKTTKMPLLQGSNINSRTGIRITKKTYIIIKNIQVIKYVNGINANNSIGIIVDNCITKDIGDSSWGRGIYQTSSKRSRITNCIAINGSGVNFSLSGDFNLIKNAKSYCNGTYNPTDYYFGLEGSNNIVIDTYAKRDGNLSHSGHALSIQTPTVNNSNAVDPNSTKYNLSINHTSVNIIKAIEFRHGGTKYNIARGLISYGEGAGSAAAGGVMFRDNASFNTVENSYIYDAAAGINFSESKEIGVGLGHNNLVVNSIFSNVTQGIFVRNDSGLGNGANNKVYNCTFYNMSRLFNIYRSNIQFSNCEFKNNIVYKVSKLSSGSKLQGWVYDNNNFYNNSFKTPKGKGNVSVNPEFIDASNGNFRLKSTSKLINAGKNLSEVNRDFDGNARSQGASSDIGAFEYEEDTTAIVNSDTDKDAKVTNPPPADANAGDDISICLGESVTLNGAGGNTYKWDTGDTGKDINVEPTRTTTYELTATRGGVTNTDTVTVTVENCNISSSLEENDLSKGFIVYPSPTTGILNINVSNLDKEELNLTLTSINGSIVYSDKMSSKQSEITKQIDLSRFAKGIYFVRLFNSNQNMVKKVLVI